MIEEIDQLLTEAGALDQAGGRARFPVAPVTLPLKVIKSELENAVTGLIRTRDEDADGDNPGRFLLANDPPVPRQLAIRTGMEAHGSAEGPDQQGTPQQLFCPIHEAARSMVEGGFPRLPGRRPRSGSRCRTLLADAPTCGPIVTERLSRLEAEKVPQPHSWRDSSKQIESQIDHALETDLLTNFWRRR